jgi:hypothetical protein
MKFRFVNSCLLGVWSNLLKKQMFYPLNYGASLESEAKVLSKAGIDGLKKPTPELLPSAGVGVGVRRAKKSPSSGKT